MADAVQPMAGELVARLTSAEPYDSIRREHDRWMPVGLDRLVGITGSGDAAQFETHGFVTLGEQWTRESFRAWLDGFGYEPLAVVDGELPRGDAAPRPRAPGPRPDSSVPGREVVYREDRGSFAKPVRTPQGFLRAEGYLTRTGVFEYALADGTVQRELRLADEVFDPRSLATFRMAPLTLEHPAEDVTADNVRQLAVGVVGDDVRRDGDHVRATVLIMDRDAIEQAESGERQELSCGYWAEYEPTPGVHDGQRYDGIQRNIRGNHVAQVTAGRMGPSARVRLDSRAAGMVAPENEPGRAPGRGGKMATKKVEIDGTTFELEEAAATALSTERGKHDDALVGLRQEIRKREEEGQQLRARLDAAEEDVKAERAARGDAERPERVRAQVQERLKLERLAHKILGDEDGDGVPWRFADMADRELKEAVIRHYSPEVDLRDKSLVYVDARFDHAVEQSATERQSEGDLEQFRARADELSRSPNPRDPEAARARMLARNRDMYKTPLAATKVRQQA